MAPNDDYDFKPKLGRIRSRGGKKGRTYLQRVLQSAGLAGPGFKRIGLFAFTGARIGRGAGQGTRAALRQQARFPGRRRVIIKTRIVKLKGQGAGAARAHLKYVQRDGVTREGEPGQLYDATTDEANGKGFLERGEGDRHQFRFIVSPEDATEMADLRPFIRDFMAKIEIDLGTELDWVAVDHFNTDNPHSHIVLRGKDELEKDLVIARDYITHGMRERASELLTIELGPVSEDQVRRGYKREIERERFTRLDRELLRNAEEGLADLRTEPRGEFTRFKHALKIGRLQKLERMGLAREEGPKRWRLSPELEPTLRAMGERGDIIKTMHREMRNAGVERTVADYAIFDPSCPEARIVGQVMARGFSDEINDRHYLLVDGLDGRTHYATVGELIDPGDFERGAIVAVEAKKGAPRKADRMISEIAERTGGLYSEELHRRHHPNDSEEFVRSHVRRLEAMRRANLVQRFPDGSWEIPESFPDKAQAFEEKARSRQPARLTLLSSFGLNQMIEADGAAWLDRQLVGKTPDPMRDLGFGRDAKEAVERRRRWLITQGLAEESGSRTVYQQNFLRTLGQRELKRVGTTLASEVGKRFSELADGDRIVGEYRRPVRLASGKFALIEKSKEFTLVPWRDVLERYRGRQVAGVIRGDGVSWSFTRGRGKGIS